jgi:hypothetical protein
MKITTACCCSNLMLIFCLLYRALWVSEYSLCTPDTQVLFLSGAHTYVAYATFRSTGSHQQNVGSQNSYQLYHLVLRHLSQVVKNPPCLGFKPGTSRTKVRCSNHYTIELLNLIIPSRVALCIACLTLGLPGCWFESACAVSMA